MLFIIAWRNIWRNKRRTLITAASVFFAIILAVFMRSATDGVYEGMIKNVVSFSSGYIQIHHKNYWDERSIENAIKEEATLNSVLLKNKDILYFTPRIESFALASAKSKTKGIGFIGIDPLKEKTANKLSDKIKVGSYFLSNKDNGIILGEGLADYFKVTIGDSLILISQGYHATSAAGIFPVRGIISLGSPQLNNNLAYLTLSAARNFLSADSLVTSISLYLSNVKSMNIVSEKLHASLNNFPVQVMTWKEMMPEMDQFITADKSGHLIIIAILYLVISFGLYSTVLMMTYERQHEFGILVSIGMKKSKLMFLVFLETMFVTFFGALLGMGVSFLVILYFVFFPIRFSGDLKQVYESFGIEPIINMSLNPYIFYYQALIIFLLALAVTIYPSIRILKLKPVEAMRS